MFLMQSLAAAARFNPASVRQQADRFGARAKVRLKLATGEKLVGSIEAIQDDGLLFAAGGAPAPRLIAYDRVTQLQLARGRYTASRQPDPIQVGRVVSALGVGQHVVVNRAAGKAIHG